MKYLVIILIIILKITVDLLSYKYMISVHEKDKAVKKDYSFKKSLRVYIASMLFNICLLIIAYYFNSLIFEFTNETLIIVSILILYSIITVESFVHSNVTVEYLKYLLRNKESSKRLVILIINIVFTLAITYISILAFVPLLYNVLASLFRLIMLSSNILSFTLVIIYKEIKPIIFKKNGK